MTKGSYPAGRNGKIEGHYVYVEGKGWVYRPLPKEVEWVELGPPAPRERRADD